MRRFGNSAHRTMVILALHFAGFAFVLPAPRVLGDDSNKIEIRGIHRAEGKLTLRQGHALKDSNAETPPWALTQKTQSSARSCGAYSLYAFLRLIGVSCALGELVDEVPISENGTDMLSLKTIARRYGVDAQVVEAKSDVVIGSAPAIARLQTRGQGAQAHFVIVAGASAGHVHIIDGTSGESLVVPADDFAKSYSGFAIVKSPEPRVILTVAIFDYALTAICLAELVFLATMISRRVSTTAHS